MDNVTVFTTNQLEDIVNNGLRSPFAPELRQTIADKKLLMCQLDRTDGLEQFHLRNFTDIARYIGQFFSRREKHRYNHRNGGDCCYTPEGVEHAKNCAQPNICEFWMFGLEAVQAEDGWRDEPEHFPSWLLDVRELIEIAHSWGHWHSRLILRALASAYGAERTSFSQLLKRRCHRLRLERCRATARPYFEYAGQTARRKLRVECPLPGVRVVEREDINLLTLIPTAITPSLTWRQHGSFRSWHETATRRRDLVYAVFGEMLEYVTGGSVKAISTMVPEGNPGADLYFLRFFAHPKEEAVLSAHPAFCRNNIPLPITAGELKRPRLERVIRP